MREPHRPSARRHGDGALNRIEVFLEANRERLGLEQYGLREPASYVLVTPRFRASRHVVFLVLPRESAEPALVAKIPRLKRDTGGLAREYAGLTAAQKAPVLAGTIPQIVAFEESLLVETALQGAPLTRSDVRRLANLVQTVVDWLLALPRVLGHEVDYSRLLEAPLRRVSEELGGTETELVERTLKLVAPLRGASLPLTLEHGDLSEPNLIRLDGGRVGLVDWELSEPGGLPAHDLFFFLAYVAFARTRAASSDEQVAAVHDAVVAPDGWARPVAVDYARRAGVPRALLGPLFVATWARYFAGLLERLGRGGLRPETAEWLVANRFHALWRLAVEHADGLEWPE